MSSPPSAVLDRLYDIIQERKLGAPPGSYTAALLAKGRTEVVLASAQAKNDRVIYESADLIYHLFVLLAAHDIAPSDLYAELERRMKP